MNDSGGWGYASAADAGAPPGPPVSGMSHGAMIIFDATPPRVLRASPAVNININNNNVNDNNINNQPPPRAPPSPSAAADGAARAGAAMDDEDETSDAAAGAAAAGAARVRTGDIVTVILEASKPVRYPVVTINSRPAWVTRISWDGTAYQASRQITEDDKSGAISFYVQPVVDFAGNVDGAGGTSEFTRGVPPRVERG